MSASMNMIIMLRPRVLIAITLIICTSQRALAADTAQPISWPTPRQQGLAIVGWSAPAADAAAPELDGASPPPADLRLPVGGDATFRRLVLDCPRAGTLVLAMDCPRPLKAWTGGVQVVDESLAWRDPQRRARIALIMPVVAGRLTLTIQVGARSIHPKGIDDHCPSRHRAEVLAMVATAMPDVLTVDASLQDAQVPACVLRFPAGQFRKDGMAFQEVTMRALAGAGTAAELPQLATALGAGLPVTGISDDPHAPAAKAPDLDRPASLPGAPDYVPVMRGDLPRLRADGGFESRAEPASQVAVILPLTVSGPHGAVTVAMPVFEGHGRNAPQREYRTLAWPGAEALLAAVPEPVLPARYAGFQRLYTRSWQMVLELVRSAPPTSGLPNAYVGTARKTFLNEVFVWDSCFTAMATVYGWRAFPHTATLDMLYSFQQDGGYIPRESAVADGLPLLYEPDFSPNPPMPAVAELALARQTGDLARLRTVYPILSAYHAWLRANRRLPDGTYWTTGLANGLVNSPSLGDGYPDLTAQMAHAAECLGIIADALGLPAEAEAWRSEHDAIGVVCNARLWDEGMRFYSTSLADGKHNPNKVVTGFWPLWAGIVPAERVPLLAAQLMDPATFWRVHPVPSLAADSPSFKPGGNYWLGSVWAPTETMVAKGFQRNGRLDLARALTVKHLEAMLAVFDATGSIWENYGSEKLERGNQSGPDYSWSISGPIRLLIETLLGVEADALHRTVRWTPLPGETNGLKRLAMGDATISLVQVHDDGGDHITVSTDRPFTLELVDATGKVTVHAIAVGETRIAQGGKP